MLEGLDLSAYQVTTPPLAGLAFGFARATISATPDAAYSMHAAHFRAAGIVAGAYAYGHPTIGIAQQVAALLGEADAADLFALDVEGGNMTWAQAGAFIVAMHDAGERCGLYASDGVYRDVGQDFRWIATYDHPPTSPYDFWQYTSSGHIPPYSGRLDLDHFHGDAAALSALVKGPNMIVPMQLGHIVVTADPGAHLYSAPDLGAQLPTVMPKGTRIRKYGGVPGWQNVQITGYGGTAGVGSLMWLKSSDVAADPQPLTVIDGLPSSGDVTHTVVVTVDGVAKATVPV